MVARRRSLVSLSAKAVAFAIAFSVAVAFLF